MKRIRKVALVLTALALSACQLYESNQPLPLLLISIDGFKPVYLETFDTPNLDRIADAGVLSESLKPVFPTKTFPTHYSMVTGLYPENTGVISNTMFDSLLGERFSLGNQDAVSDGRWYGGEPIWVTAEKQDRPTATLFWPGSEAEINGVRPTRWLPYDGRISHAARVDSIVTWLQDPGSTRPVFLTLYFSSVDSRGHRYGPGSEPVRQAVEEVDARIGDLLDELERIGLWPDINVMITSDHGMTELSRDRVIFLDELISLDDVRVHDWTPVAMLEPRQGRSENVFQALREQENHYRVYRKQELPDRFRLRNHHRVPEILVIADPGYTITSRPFFESRGVMAGGHGYDNEHPDMQGFFLAAGPSFRRGSMIGPVDSIHLYELMCHLLRVEPAPNQGTLDSLRHVLRR